MTPVMKLRKATYERVANLKPGDKVTAVSLRESHCFGWFVRFKESCYIKHHSEGDARYRAPTHFLSMIWPDGTTISVDPLLVFPGWLPIEERRRLQGEHLQAMKEEGLIR